MKHTSASPVIKPCGFVSSHKQTSLTGVSRDQITAKLGFKPSGLSGDEKSECQWEFTLDGEPASIWDWHGGGRSGEWSVFNVRVLELFRN